MKAIDLRTLYYEIIDSVSLGTSVIYSVEFSETSETSPQLLTPNLVLVKKLNYNFMGLNYLITYI
jgi:hypothetical protein